MTDLLAARWTMALSLGFHIIFAAIGMVMPFLMATAHRQWLKTGDDDAYRLTKMWMRGTAIFFATGAVSGTALSFELGLLWPTFMKHAGPIFGMPFSLEGTAFFIEAIALGLYMYGWEKIHPKVHWWTGIVVGLSGVASGILVVSANGWMNSPTGFDWVAGEAINIDPWKALLNDAWATQSTHMTLAAFEAVGFAVAGIHAFLKLRHPDQSVHDRGLKIALAFGATAALLQPINGHWAAQDVAERQPIKLAAMEAHFHTEKNAGLLVGGIPDEKTRTVSAGIKLPGMLSVLAFNSFDAEVVGLEEFPEEEWPPVMVVHFAFQIMVGIGTLLALVGLFSWIGILRKPEWFENPKVLKLLAFLTPFGFIAIEAGWVVTEVGRQPWIIYGIMKTQDAVTPVPGQIFHLLAFASLYLIIGTSCLAMWRRQVKYAQAIDGPTESVKKWAL